MAILESHVINSTTDLGGKSIRRGDSVVHVDTAAQGRVIGLSQVTDRGTTYCQLLVRWGWGIDWVLSHDVRRAY